MQPQGRTFRQPDAPQVPSRITQWFRMSPRGMLYMIVLGLLFLYFSRRPLWHTDLWGHLAYGRLIAETGSIPETEPFMPLAQDVPLVDTMWLSQWIGYHAYSVFGVTAMQFLYAAAITFCLALLTLRFHEQTRNIVFVGLGLAAFLWMEWQAFKVVRPQLAGLCCFITLFGRLSRRNTHDADWFLVPLLMALWVNLHGSFPLGLLLLGTYCVGRGLDVWRRTGRWERAAKDRRARRLFLLMVLSAAAVLLNPYGIEIYAAPFSIAANPNMADLVEWQPLTLRMKQGQAAFTIALVLIVVLRFSPRRVVATEGLLLAGLGAAALWSSRMLVWWAPVATVSLVGHGYAVYGRWRKPAKQRASFPKRSLWACASIAVAAAFFAVSPFGLRLLFGVRPKLERAVSRETPVGAAAYLREHPPAGLIFNPDRWGDYLVWAGPPDLPVFITTHAHLVPRTVWNDYLYIDAGWIEGLDRYGVNTVVTNRARQIKLSRRLWSSSEWRLVYHDDQSLIFRRRNLMPSREE